MEKKLEATLRKALDKLLQSTLENRYYRLMDDTLLDLTKSKRDFLFGVVVGDMLEGLGFCTYGAYKRHPKDEEFKELYKLVHRRAQEIQGKIQIILSK
jgi:hypothetical protein